VDVNILNEALAPFTDVVMSYASALLNSGIRRLLGWQAIIVLVLGGGGGVFYGRYHAFSLLYGGGLAMVVAILLGWRLQKINASPMQGSSGLLHIYLGAVERFVVVVLGMGAGMGWLRLPPFPMIVGFAAAQAGYLFKMPDYPTGNIPPKL
jgi:ATP synthase protein I